MVHFISPKQHERQQKLRELAARRSREEQRKIKLLTEQLDQIKFREFLTTSKKFLEGQNPND